MEENPELKNEGVKEENIVPQKSKSQIKKEKNKQKWLDDKPKRRELQKAKKKAQKEQKRLEREANQKAKGIDVHHPRPEGAEPPKTNKQIKQEFLKNIEEGQPLIIDCSSQDLLTEKELMSLCRQLGHCQAANKKAEKPAKIIVTGYKGKLKDQLTKMGGENWGMKLMENHYLDYFPKDQLVYLTGDATEDLIEIDKNTHYIIGGLVDHNRLKFATLNQAQSEGLRVIRLPIGQHIALKSSTILSVNHVFELMLKVSNGQSWKDAIQSTIPDRKREGHEGTRKKARKAKAKGEESKGDENDNEEGDGNEDEGENENGNEEQIPVENNNTEQQTNTEMNQENNEKNINPSS